MEQSDMRHYDSFISPHACAFCSSEHLSYQICALML
jgi:hypothetical protein